MVTEERFHPILGLSLTLSPYYGLPHWLHHQTLCGGKMLQQPFCPLRFNFRGKEQVLQFQNPKPFIATCWLLLGHVIIFEPITVAKLM